MISGSEYRQEVDEASVRSSTVDMPCNASGKILERELRKEFSR